MILLAFDNLKNENLQFQLTINCIKYIIMDSFTITISSNGKFAFSKDFGPS